LRQKTSSTSEYLAFLSAKYEVDPDRLFYALTMAEVSKKSVCGDLSIEWRGETRDKVMFLILANSKVVAQLSVFKEFLLEKGHPIRDFMETDKIRRFITKRARQSYGLQIRDLRSGMAQVCLKAKVLEIPKPSLVYTRYGNYASVANALIADETGTIRLCLWNEQIQSISAGDTIQIENARASTFKGQRQLNIGRKGLLSSVDESSCQVKALVSS
jgi:Single-stranded DNA binding protein Ssb-like, OB fold